MIRKHLRRPYAFLLSLLRLIWHLPGFAPFLPLLWRAAFTPDSARQANDSVPGALTPEEREWLAAQARRTPANAAIVQMGPPEADVTCALAAGCWASRRRVYVLWPEAADGLRLREWHRTIIRQGFAPYVTPVVGAKECAGPIDLFYAETSADPPSSAKIIVRRRAPGASEPLPGQVEACGTLAALKSERA